MPFEPIADVPDRRVAVRVTRDALRWLRSGHPWVFEDSVVDARGPVDEPGALAVVFDERRRFRAVGLWDPTSPIRIRRLAGPDPETIDRAFLARRVDEALDRRAVLTADGNSTGLRLVHGENDGLGGLVLDEYGAGADRVLVAKAYSPAWAAWLGPLVELLVDRRRPSSVVLRLAGTARPGRWRGWEDGRVLTGPPPPARVPYLENGLRFEADPRRGQKTGAFLDQRDNRARVRDRMGDGSMLDVFCCQGGFAVHAAAGGASRVVGIDQSRPAVEQLERNLAGNGLAGVAGRHRVGDAFAALEALAREGRRFDLVVVDPPSFANRQAQVEGALAAYRRLTGLALGVLTDGGTLVQASCSARVGGDAFETAVRESASAAGRPLRDVERHGHAVDHPIGFAEGAYLQAVFGRA